MDNFRDGKEILIFGHGLMGAPVIAWQLLLGQRVRVWTNTNKTENTKEKAFNKAMADIQKALESYSKVCAAMAADDPDLLDVLPQVSTEVLKRLTIQVENPSSGEDDRSALGIWLVIDCTRDLTKKGSAAQCITEKNEAINKISGLFKKVHEESPEAVLAIKHEAIEPCEVEDACKLPVIRVRFLLPVFFIQYVEVLGTNRTMTSRVTEWLAEFQLTPFSSLERVRMDDAKHSISESTLFLMRRYARQYYKGEQPSNEECQICWDAQAEVLSVKCGHSMMCYQCSLKLLDSRCPVCRAEGAYGPDALMKKDACSPLAASSSHSPVSFGIDSVDELLIAAQHGDTPRVQQLLLEGADVNATNPGGYTALITAAVFGQQHIVRVLLDARADVELQTSSGNTALLGAAIRGHTDLMHFLISKGASVSPRNVEGYSVEDLME